MSLLGSNNTLIYAESLSKIFKIKKKGLSSIGHFLNLLFPSYCKSYTNNFYALKEVSFSLKKGDSMGIIGLNGAGKSTLLQILSGVLKPTSGIFNVEGKVASLLELGAGFNPEFTGKENIYLYASIFGLSSKVVDEKLDSIIKFSEIEEFIELPVKTYSTGMFVRLAFSVIAHLDADILLIDEAFAVGDSAFTQKCLRFIHAFKKTGVLILVSHDHSTIQNLCEKCIWLDKGSVKLFGSSRDVIDAYVAEILCGTKKEAFKLSKSFCLGRNHFGNGGAEIKSVQLRNKSKHSQITFLNGSEEISLEIDVLMTNVCKLPVFGFIIRDTRGLELFSSNTSSYTDLKLLNGDFIRANFIFNLPILKRGSYSVSVAVCEKKGSEFLPMHWINDALYFESCSSESLQGLVGIDIKEISFQKL